MEENEEGVDLNECSNCIFYATEDYEMEGINYQRTFGVCRRFPPRRIDGLTSGFPIVEDDWWCGEHQKKFALEDK
jgi:hypothetical protein